MFKCYTLLALLATSIIMGCGTTQKVTYSWTNPSFKPEKKYQKIFLAALVNNPHVRTHLEDEMGKSAASQGMTLERSLDYFPVSFREKAPASREKMMEKIKELNCDLIFTITLVEKSSETRYVQSGLGFYGPYAGYGLQFRGFYSYWYPYYFDPGYYVTDKTYFMEGNLFDAKSETLIWSIQTRTINPASIERFSTDLVSMMLEKALTDLKTMQK
jgi:hypothetical protein